MTLKNRTALINQANSTLPDNESQEISPADVRDMIKDVLDSFVSKNGDTGILGPLQYGNSYTIDNGKQLVFADWVTNQIVSLGKYKGEWVSGPYLDGDLVLHDLLLWEANADNTAEEPGTGASWDRQITNDDAFGFGYTGSMLGVTQNRFYQVVNDLENDYYKLNGTFPLTGDMDVDGNNLNNIHYATADIFISKNTTSTTNCYFNAQGPYAQFVMNENPLGVFDDATKAAPQFVLYSAIGDSEVQFYTSSVNGVTASLSAKIDKNKNIIAMGNAIVDDTTKGLVLKSSVDSHYYQYKAGVAGALVITDLGTSY